MIERMKRLDRKLMYQGSILDVYKDTMEFPNGTHKNGILFLIEWERRQFFRYFRMEES